MGLFGAGERLMGEASGERSDVTFYVADIRGREFAVRIVPEWIDDDRILVLGLDRKALSAVVGVDDEDIHSLSDDLKDYLSKGEWEDVSVFPDGSLFGIISAKAVRGLASFPL